MGRRFPLLDFHRNNRIPRCRILRPIYRALAVAQRKWSGSFLLAIYAHCIRGQAPLLGLAASAS
jgi:hypothetical protein